MRLWHFFFFKQKTAYEMRISDWSSDVCSSDLSHGIEEPAACAVPARNSSSAASSSPCPAGHSRLGSRMRPDRWGSGFTEKRKAWACEIGRASCRERVCQYV